MKALILVTLTLLLLCGFAGAQNTFCAANQPCTVSGNWTFTGPNSPPQPANNVDWTGRNRFANFQDHTINQALMTGSDWGARVSAAWQMMVNLSWTNGTVEGRTHGVPQTSAGSFFTNYPYTPGQPCTFTGHIDFDAPILTDVSQVVPCQASMDGHSPHAGFWANVNGGTIQASNAFPINTPVIQFGAASWSGVVGGTPPQGVVLKDMAVIGMGPNGVFKSGSSCVLNALAQEGSRFEGMIHLDGCQILLDRENGGTISGSLNDGPYAFHGNLAGCNTTACKCIQSGMGNGINSNNSRGFRDFSCNINGATVQPAVGVAIDGENIPVQHGHLEGFGTDIELGALGYAKAIHVSDIEGVELPGNHTTTVVDISSHNFGGNTSGNVIENIVPNGAITNIFVDNMSPGCTLTNGPTSATLPFYAHMPGPTVISGVKDCPSTMWFAAGSITADSLGSPLADFTLGAASKQWTVQSGAAQAKSPFRLLGNSGSASSYPLLEVLTSATNEKTFLFTLTGKNQLTQSAATGDVQLVQLNAATSGANLNTYNYLQQGAWWNGTAGAIENFSWGVTYGTGANPTTTAKYNISGSSGTGLHAVDFTNWTKMLAKNLSTNTASNTDLAGQVTLAGGTGTYTFAQTYASAPICVATDTTAAAAVRASASTTVLTLTGTGTDVINYVCVGRN